MTATGKPTPTTPGDRLRKSVMGPEVVCWPALPPDKEQAVAAELVVWVTWLAGRYDLDRRTIPECWQRHGALVEELSALRSAWQLAFSRTAPKDAPLTWHAGFAHSRARLVDWVSRDGCRAGVCRVAGASPVSKASDSAGSASCDPGWISGARVISGTDLKPA